MTLALFDLDNTLLNGDSDYLWGKFLGAKGLVDAVDHEERNQAFYDEYRQGTLDIYAYLRFQLRFLVGQSPERLADLHRQYMAEYIHPIILPAGRRLMALHRQQQEQVVIITATNRFVTAPIAQALAADHLLATELAMAGSIYTGEVMGTPCFQEGKVIRLQQWMQENNETLVGSWFYSDSHNDLPLLGMVDHPVAVDPDEVLADYARSQGWPVISLRTDLAGGV